MKTLIYISLLFPLVTLGNPSLGDNSLTSSLSKKLGDLDLEVKDIKLRVESGKKRQYSSSLGFIYKSGTMKDPGAEYRPAIGDETRPDETGIAGNLSLRYRVDKNKSFFFATGFNQRRPFHELSDHEKSKGEDKDLELYSPQLGFNSTFALKSWELGSSVRSYYNTLSFRRQLGEVGGISYSLSTLRNYSDSKIRAGITLNTAYIYFNKDFAEIKGKTKDVRSLQVDYKISLLPSIQYNFSEKFNAYTSLTLLNFVHKRNTNSILNFEGSPLIQTLGVGYSVFRDFYISPYLNFEPTRLSVHKTLLNLKTNINF